MSETWADTQFDLLEAAYNEIPVEAKARIEQRESSLDEVAEKWAIAQVNYEDCARRNTLLEALVRDMRLTPAEYVRKHCVTDDVKGSDAYWWMYESVGERMAALGLLGGDAE